LTVAASLLATTGCGGGTSRPRLVDGSRVAELPAALKRLDGAVLTRTRVVAAKEVDQHAMDACGFVPRDGGTAVVERVGLNGSSITFAGTGSSLYACDKIPDPATAADPDLPWGGVWCGGSAGRFSGGTLDDPRLDLCSNTEDDVVAFVWVEPGAKTKWLVVSDAGTQEVYDVAASLPVRITTTHGIDPAGRASFHVGAYGADGTRLRESTLSARVAG
jgi:hypothetical protein